ncbi:MULTISPECIES: exo-alpha-(1-_6)-L-arabinopyranosidase [unclassified Bifidobacterium]|uniref:exo-alpha-(1->6)-L-arabinopyranosidase n=1 Tax=unclassified Bifidobacterium TaxID=2608897 RepID=UPI0023FA02EF|nr:MULTISPECIES: exo-alpha-(1->6)-L-arabinopyranosidase [unclassified Bifidobacterium]WEV66234.1 glycoside hydrolase family 3 C-terminal domain-containing protein [Bifidobacterium sp. ESL0764]WEV74979.1 glycoside hydrolase family 3 C-terminal domain-containing protein [Bifidobacterium sp. ESL0800]
MSASTRWSLDDFTLEEKASLTSGGDSWHLQAIADKGVPGYMVTDGPHGLRKAANSSGSFETKSVPATCFPPAAGLSSSWNPQLVDEVGRAMGEECVQEQVAVILGPGVNIKRSPLGGRCFEFWSEDPYLSGHVAVGMVTGIQSEGVGTSLKHFAVNNQETDRMRVSANVSERAMREIYFPAFEYIVKTAQPWTVMCSYNRINGVYAAQNHWLLTDILRKEWGFKGIVLSDWGADHNRVDALNAGMNLEMPPTDTDSQIVDAVRDGRIDVVQLDRMASGVLDLMGKAHKSMSAEGYRYDVDAHHETARRAAQESIVMLKNEGGILPVGKDRHLAVIGEFARTPRYQGGGSSHINPTRLSSFLDALSSRGIQFDFAPGFTLDDKPQDEQLTKEALNTVKGADTVLMFIGLPDEMESEGGDRTSLDLPAKQIDLLTQVSAINSHVVVVLSNGGVVSVAPWRDKAQGILESWLLGQAGGEALADIIEGDVSPSGKLAETIPMKLQDDPTIMNWPGGARNVDYGEGVFVGYRYYDTFDKPVAYPFGYGLSYADFKFSDIEVDKTGSCAALVEVTVTNTSNVAASQTVEIYVAPGQSEVQRPRHELKGFKKVFLKSGESKTVSIQLDARSFAYWSDEYHDWHVEPGVYGIEVGTSSRDIVQSVEVRLDGDGKSLPLSEWSFFSQWQEDPLGAKAIEQMEADAAKGKAPKLPTDDALLMSLLAGTPINSFGVLMGKPGTEVPGYLLKAYGQLRNK